MPTKIQVEQHNKHLNLNMMFEDMILMIQIFI